MRPRERVDSLPSSSEILDVSREVQCMCCSVLSRQEGGFTSKQLFDIIQHQIHKLVIALQSSSHCIIRETLALSTSKPAYILKFRIC